MYIRDQSQEPGILLEEIWIGNGGRTRPQILCYGMRASQVATQLPAPKFSPQDLSYLISMYLYICPSFPCY